MSQSVHLIKGAEKQLLNPTGVDGGGCCFQKGATTQQEHQSKADNMKTWGKPKHPSGIQHEPCETQHPDSVGSPARVKCGVLYSFLISFYHL